MKNVLPAFFRMAKIQATLAAAAKEFNLKTTEVSGNIYRTKDSKVTSHRLQQPIIISHKGLVHLCTRNEFYIIGMIMDEMYEYNALWKVDEELKRKNGTYKRGVAGLVRKEILYPTETPHFFIVNPAFIRRGDPFAVTAVTANMLMNRKPNDTMLCDKRPVTHFDFSLAGLPDPGTT